MKSPLYGIRDVRCNIVPRLCCTHAMRPELSVDKGMKNLVVASNVGSGLLKSKPYLALARVEAEGSPIL